MLQDICLFCLQYKNPEITRKDVVNAIQQYKGLVPKFEPFGKYSCFFFIMDILISLLAYLFIYLYLLEDEKLCMAQFFM